MILDLQKVSPNDFLAADKTSLATEFVNVAGDLTKLASAHGLKVSLPDEGSMLLPGALYCGAIHDENWIILPGGRVTKCTAGFHDRSKDAGYLSSSGEIVVTNRERSWSDYNPARSEPCSSCEVLPVCMGGCSITKFGNPHYDRCTIKTNIERIVTHRARREATISSE